MYEDDYIFDLFLVERMKMIICLFYLLVERKFYHNIVIITFLSTELLICLMDEFNLSHTTNG